MLDFDTKSIELFSAFVHDSSFMGKDIPKDLIEDKFILEIERIYWEKPFEAKFLFLFNVIKYKSINSNIIIDMVKEFNVDWKDNAFDSPEDNHCILDIIYKHENNTIEIETEYIIFRLNTDKSTKIILNDYSELSKKFVCTDLFKQIFNYQDWKTEYNKVHIKNG